MFNKTMILLRSYLTTILFKLPLITALDNGGPTNTKDFVDLSEENTETIFKIIKHPGG